MSISIAAVICVRNEATYLRNLIPYLASEGIEVTLIDNASTDGTQDEFTPQKYPNIVARRDLPFPGSFDLSAQLVAKAAEIDRLRSDWVCHQDADEILQSPDSWGGLRRCIEEVDADGFTVLNFNELVMLPVEPDVDDYMANNRRYYFFEPRPLRLMRAWRRSANLTNLPTGGHVLSGDNVYVSPKRMLLKHFIVRSQEHAIRKYVGRTFSDCDTARGWHGNRVGLTEDLLRLPESGPYLHTLDSPLSSPSTLPRSAKVHYWHW